MNQLHNSEPSIPIPRIHGTNIFLSPTPTNDDFLRESHKPNYTAVSTWTVDKILREQIGFYQIPEKTNRNLHLHYNQFSIK